MRMRMRLKVNRFLLLLLLTFSFTNAVSQQKFGITVTPHHKDWKYQLGDNVQFLVAITEEVPSSNTFSVQYEIGAEKMPPTISKKIHVKSRLVTIEGGTMHIPGFLRCKVTVTNGEEVYSAIAKADEMFL